MSAFRPQARARSSAVEGAGVVVAVLLACSGGDACGRKGADEARAPGAGARSIATEPSKEMRAAWNAIPDPLPWGLAARRAARDALAAFVRDFPADNPFLERGRFLLARLQAERALDVGYEYAPLPGGTFTMGVVSSEEGKRQSDEVTHPVGLKCKFKDPWGDETGSHQVKVPGFALGRTEVTNAQYNACFAGGGCSTAPHYDDETCFTPHRNGWKLGRPPGILREDARPVVCIEWGQAEQVCRWLAGCPDEGCGLPSEARWEYAARGTGGQNRMYPWGNERDVWNRANYCGSECNRPWRDDEHTDGHPFTAPVGSFPQGATPEGLLDMGGNVWEWVRDHYAGSFGGCGPGCAGDDPKGPEKGEERVIRGGDWACGACHVRTTSRDGNDPHERLPSIGVRCSREFDDRSPR
jgi:formylglycine-generating enzyme required for sulfatase activity